MGGDDPMKIPFLDTLLKENTKRPEHESGPLFSTGEEDLIFREHFKGLRSKLEYKAEILGWKVIGVTSSIAGEGKTLICVKVAVSLALTKRKKVLLVDADIRKGDLSKGVGIPVEPGLTDYLVGNTDIRKVLRNSKVPGLDTISSGTSVPAPADLLAGDGFRIFIKEARERYDIVLLDTPPVLPVADTMSIREQVDGFLFVYRVGFTPITMFQQASEEIGEKKILGVVLNGVEPKSDRYYGRYYGHYYTSGKTTEALR
ncbi:MAG: polysaccharide biosynthesis tyrosine autokinase [Deltaproteobacteria bacterium]|nr:MAG: polysaccharide biosynthesis tyrosine autokinase [Deltaproteobacteria bacterium]